MTQLGVARGHSFSFSGLSRKTTTPGVLVDQQFGKATLVWRKSTPGFRGFLAAHGLGIGIGIDVALTSFFQIGADYWTNPFLTPGQKIGQFSVTLGSAALVSGLTYASIGLIGLSGGTAIIPAIIIATAYTIVISPISNTIQQGLGFSQETRSLMPLKE